MVSSIAGSFSARCGKCLYWEQHDKVGTMGECKRYPPQVIMIRKAKTRNSPRLQYGLSR
jgi:hypothetical protein